jgi:glycosyltransferase involved in cell wall biosynthesis
MGMKVLIATPLYPPDDGGPATRARVLEEEFPKAGVQVDLLSYSHFRKYKKGVSHFLYFMALCRRARGVDIIYALDQASVGLPAALAALILQKPLVVCIVGDYAWEQGVQRSGVKENLDDFVLRKDYPFLVRFLRRVQCFVASRAVRIITPSHYLKGIISAWGIREEKIIVIYNAFDPSLVGGDKDALRKKLAIVGRAIISVGRAVPWKGFTTLMDAVAQLRKDIPDATLYIAGSGDQLPYQQYANEHGYTFVHMLGLLPHESLMEWLRASDCVALNTGYEGLSHVLLETMALETPIVTTAVGGNIELLQSERGLLVPYNDRVLLSQALRSCFTERNATDRHTKNACAFARTLTQENMVRETSLAFKQIL